MLNSGHPWFRARNWLWLICLFGILIRLRLYLLNFPLLEGEAFYSLQVLHQSFRELLGLSGQSQSAAAGFLWAEKLMVMTFGNQEYVLRAFPLFCGVMLLIVLRYLLPLFLNTGMAVLALMVFAFFGFFVEISCTVSPVSSALLVAALILWTTLILHQKERIAIRHIAGAGTLGVSIVWFSVSVPVLLASGAFGLTILSLIHRQWRKLVAIFLITLMWAGGFMIYDLLCGLTQTQGNIENWLLQKNCTGANSGLLNLWDQTVSMVFLRTIPLNGLILFSFMAGVVAWFSKHKGRLMLVLMPLVLLCILPWLLQRRLNAEAAVLIVVIAPIVLAGIEIVYRKSSRLAGGFLMVCLISTAAHSGWVILNSRSPEKDGKRYLVNYFKAHKKASDRLLVCYGPNPTLEYYFEKTGMKNQCPIINQKMNPNVFLNIRDSDVALADTRAWILFTEPKLSGSWDQGFLTSALLLKNYKVSDFVQTGQGGLYLYEAVASGKANGV